MTTRDWMLRNTNEATERQRQLEDDARTAALGNSVADLMAAQPSDNFRSDEQLIDAAHDAVARLGDDNAVDIADDAITALGKRLEQLREERQDAEDIAAHARELVAPVVSGVLELDSFLRHRGRP